MKFSPTMIKSILIDARALIDEPDKWCQDWNANTRIPRARIGAPVVSPQANAFSACGAIVRVVFDASLSRKEFVDNIDYYINLISAVCWRLIAAANCRRSTNYNALEKWNDNPNRAYPDVLEAFDRAIAAGDK